MRLFKISCSEEGCRFYYIVSAETESRAISLILQNAHESKRIEDISISERDITQENICCIF